MSAVPIYAGNDFYVPAFRIVVSGQSIDTTVAHDVISMTFRDSLNAFDSVDIVLNNWDDDATGATHFRYAVDDGAPHADLFAFDANRLVVVEMGYRDVSTVQVLSGTVESLEPHYTTGSAPTLTVRLVDKLKQLRKEDKTHAWTDTSVADIARAIATQNGLTIAVTARNDDEQQPYILQDAQPDIVFLMRQARRLGYDLFANADGTLRMTPSSGAATTVYTLGFRRSIIDFAPRWTTNDQYATVQVNGRDQEGKGTFTGSASRDEIGLNADLEPHVAAEVAGKKRKLVNMPLHVNGQGKQLAREMQRSFMEGMVTATVTCPGLPDIRSGRVVQITDAGSRISGLYRVTSTTHTIDDSGYRTSFTARREGAA